jgi:DNA-directed RNA polymerase specialized sigma24 family protein
MQRDGTSHLAARLATDATGREGRHEADLDLARRVLRDDTEAWKSFVERYAGLIHSVVRKHLRSRDDDDLRSVFADVLVSLRRSKLSTYQGRASLSTWLTLVARTETLDFLRRRFGRGRGGKVAGQLTPTERIVFRLHYLEGRTAHEIMAELGQGGDAWTIDRFIACLRNIESRLGDAWLKHLSYDLYAQSVGVASGRMLEYLDHMREELDGDPRAFSPEYDLMEREARATVERLASMIRALEPRERDLLQLRFERGWTARRIARELGLDGPRGVYSITDRIVRKLRRWLEGKATPHDRALGSRDTR